MKLNSCSSVVLMLRSCFLNSIFSFVVVLIWILKLSILFFSSLWTQEAGWTDTNKSPSQAILNTAAPVPRTTMQTQVGGSVSATSLFVHVDGHLAKTAAFPGSKMRQPLKFPLRALLNTHHVIRVTCRT